MIMAKIFCKFKNKFLLYAYYTQLSGSLITKRNFFVNRSTLF